MSAGGDPEPDDRDPADRAYVAGLQASDAEAQAWAEQVAMDPEDLVSRAAWLGWASRSHAANRRAPEGVQAHLEWLVRNRPEHAISAHAAFSFLRAPDGDLGKHLDDLWLGLTESSEVRPEILGNAATHFWARHDPRAITLLTRAAKIDPLNPKWPAQAAFVHLAGAHKVSKQSAFDARFDSLACKRALEEAERAHALGQAAAPDFQQLVTHMTAAAGANDWDRAGEVARETLQRIPGAPILRVRKERTLHQAHVILGLAALRRGDRDEAKVQLRESVDCLSVPSCGFHPPNALVALEFLALGDRDPILAFFEWARPLRPDDQAEIDLWQKQVRDGRTPELGFLWTYF